MDMPASVNYNDVLADLKRRRDKLDSAIAGIEAILGMPASVTPLKQKLSDTRPDVQPTEIASDMFFGLSIVEGAKKFLALKKRPQSTTDIAAALEQGGMPNQSDNFGNTVGATLARNLTSVSPVFSKVSRGTWGLKEWYGNKKFTEQ